MLILLTDIPDVDAPGSIETAEPAEQPDMPVSSPVVNVDDDSDDDCVITSDNSAVMAMRPEDESYLRRPRRPFMRRMISETLRAAAVSNRAMTAHQSMEFMTRLQSLTPAGAVTTLTNVIFDVRRNQYRNNGGLIQRRGPLDIMEK